MTNLEDTLKQIRKSLEEARKARPDADPDDLLVRLDGTKVQTHEEVNQSGEPMIFLCMPCSHGKAYVPNCAVKQCGCCGQDVWMTPGTQASYNKLTNAQITCLDCQLKLLKSNEQGVN